MRARGLSFLIAGIGVVSAGALGAEPGFQPGSSPKWPASLAEFVRGDADGDESVTFGDVAAVLGSWNTNGARGNSGIPDYPVAAAAHQFGDATGDGFVWSFDLDAVIDAFQSEFLPEAGVARPGGREDEEQTPAPTARAIAAWNTVPLTAFSGKFGVGVVAFHIGGIDRVEFTVNGGLVEPETEMSLNPSTGVYEYTLVLDGAVLPQGAVEIGAVVIPEWGETRDLGMLRLLNRTGVETPGPIYVRARAPEEEPEDGDEQEGEGEGDESDGSRGRDDEPTGDGSLERPFERIYDAARLAVSTGADTICLLPGDHLWAGRKGGEVSIDLPEGFGWLTVAAAPGFGPSEVRIVGNSSGTGGLNAEFVRFVDISIVATSLDTNRTKNPAAWFDRCVLSGADRSDARTQFANGSSWTGGIYATGTLVTDVRTATKHWNLIRGCTFERIGSDVFHNPSVVIDCVVHDVRKEGGGAHPDLIQFNGDFENVIVYGLKATEIWAQGIFSRGSSGIPDRDMAFVNIEIDAKNYLSQWLQSADHVLFWNVSFLGRALNISNDPGRDPTVLRYLSVRECVIHDLRLDPRIRAEATQIWLGNAVGRQRTAAAVEPEGPEVVGAEE